MAILPNGCPLPRVERDLIYDTRRKGEVVCLGCWRRHDCGAAIGDDLEVAAELMGVPVEELIVEQGSGTRECKRCGDQIEEWVIEGGGRERVWRCGGTITDTILTKSGRSYQQQRDCNWSVAEVSGQGRGFLS